MEKINIYSLLGIPNGSSLARIEKRIEDIKKLKKENSEALQRIYEEYEIVKKDKVRYDMHHNFESDPEPKNNHEPESEEIAYDFAFSNKSNAYDMAFLENNQNNNKYTLYKDSKPRETNGWKKSKGKIIALVVAGATIFVSITSLINNSINKSKMNNNVCVMYEVQEEDTKNKLDSLFAEYGFSYLETSGIYRNTNLIYVGDVVIGRTTKEKADELVEQGHARIISIDEAVELLGENNSLIGEFRAYANGDSDMVFFVPDSKSKV